MAHKSKAGSYFGQKKKKYLTLCRHLMAFLQLTFSAKYVKLSTFRLAYFVQK